MYLKSPFPTPPPLPPTNAHNIFFNRPDQASWPDFTAHIDLSSISISNANVISSSSTNDSANANSNSPPSPKRTSYKEYKQNIIDLSTALGARVEEGGLGLEGWGEDVRGVDPDSVSVGPGGNELIGIMGENSSEYITLIHALIRTSLPFAPISAFSTPPELRHALSLSKATRLFVDERFLARVLPVVEEVGPWVGLRDRVYLLKVGGEGGEGGKTKHGKFNSFWKMIENVRKHNIPRIPTRPAGPNTLAYLVFSSGTSGLPKAVMISHGNLIYATSQALVIGAASMEVSPPPALKTPEGIPVTLAFLPLHHSYGLHAYSFRASFTPGTYVILPKWNITTALDAISRYKVSSLTLIPSVIHQLVNHPGTQKADLTSVSSIITGAAYMPPELGVKLLKLVPGQAHLTEGYGMSEATIGAIMQPLNGMLNGKLKRHAGSAGVLIPGMEARLLKTAEALPPASTAHDPEIDCAVNEEGELWLRSANIALGYWGNPQANSETFVGGWLRTGDRFRVDEDENFWFADRAKDTLKVSGSQVSPVEIENCLLSHPEGLISDASVAGVSGGRTQDEKIPRAWVVLTPKGQARGEEKVIKDLDRWHRVNLSKYKWLRGGIEVVDEIPKLPTGKTLRRVLQERYEERVKESKGRKAKL